MQNVKFKLSIGRRFYRFEGQVYFCCGVLILNQMIKRARALKRFPQALLVAGVGLSLGIVYGLAPVQAEGDISVNASQSAIAQNSTAYTYPQAMEIGYAATAARDYQTALINFRRALARRPGDIYATTAIRNVEVYILEARLRRATNQLDWICAARTVDELIVRVERNSLENARLVSYRGELTSLIENQVNLENWSSVCTA